MRAPARLVVAVALLSGLLVPGHGEAADVPLATCTATATGQRVDCTSSFSLTSNPYTRLRLVVTTEDLTGTALMAVSGTGRCFDAVYSRPGCPGSTAGGNFAAGEFVLDDPDYRGGGDGLTSHGYQSGGEESHVDYGPGSFTLSASAFGTGSATFSVYSDGMPSLAICRSDNDAGPRYEVRCLPQQFAVSGSTPATLRIHTTGIGNLTAFITKKVTGSCSGAGSTPCSVAGKFAYGRVLGGTVSREITLAAGDYYLYVVGNGPGYVRGEVDPR